MGYVKLMLQPKTSQKPASNKPILPHEVVANLVDRGVGLLSVGGWKNLAEVLKDYKLPYERGVR
jgi:hypothetical protein